MNFFFFNLKFIFKAILDIRLNEMQKLERKSMYNPRFICNYGVVPIVPSDQYIHVESSLVCDYQPSEFMSSIDTEQISLIEASFQAPYGPQVFYTVKNSGEVFSLTRDSLIPFSIGDFKDAPDMIKVIGQYLFVVQKNQIRRVVHRLAPDLKEHAFSTKLAGEKGIEMELDKIYAILPITYYYSTKPAETVIYGFAQVKNVEVKREILVFYIL